MPKKTLLHILLFTTTCCFAQIGGRYTYQFLNLVSSPRQAALGGKVITNYDYDVSQPLFNPATINNEMDNQLALNYVSYLGGISYGSAAYAYEWDRRIGTFHAGVTYIDYGTFEGRDANGQLTEDFTGNEVALSFGYAKNIPQTDFYVGTNVKLISSKLEQYNSLGGAVDVAGFYRNERLGMNVGLVVRNIGTQFSTYAGLREDLPLSVDLGISQEVPNVPVRWHVTLENLHDWNIAFSNPNRNEFTLDGGVTEEDVGFFQEVLRHTVIGAELFPTKPFNIRLGYNFRRAEELRIVDQRTFSGISAGFGLKMNRIRFNFAHVRYSLAGNTSVFGLMIDFSNRRGY